MVADFIRNRAQLHPLWRALLRTKTKRAVTYREQYGRTHPMNV